MKSFNLVLLALSMVLTFSACEKEEKKEEDRLLAGVSIVNFTGNGGCEPLKVTFIVSYRDIQTVATINAGSSGFINLLVSDGETVDVLIQDENDKTVADSQVTVRTTSRPEHLESTIREIRYCRAFDLQFANF